MNLYEAILQALAQCERMFVEQGEWTGEQYMEMVKPLHEALRNASDQVSLGPQRATPSSPAKINAEVKQAQAALDAKCRHTNVKIDELNRVAYCHDCNKTISLIELRRQAYER